VVNPVVGDVNVKLLNVFAPLILWVVELVVVNETLLKVNPPPAKVCELPLKVNKEVPALNVKFDPEKLTAVPVPVTDNVLDPRFKVRVSVPLVE
jgi:hypothetical protein